VTVVADVGGPGGHPGRQALADRVRPVAIGPSEGQGGSPPVIPPSNLPGRNRGALARRAINDYHDYYDQYD
jgi:hypothetical protein